MGNVADSRVPKGFKVAVENEDDCGAQGGLISVFEKHIYMRAGLCGLVHLPVCYMEVAQMANRFL